MSGHTPVLVNEVLDLFQPQAGHHLLDATLGHGGHAKAWLDKTTPTGIVTGLDADPAALINASQVLAEYGKRVTYIKANFSNLNDALMGGGIIKPPTHVLFDLGVGSHQLADDKRGFSFYSAGPLSMRYGSATDLPASQFEPLNCLTQYLGFNPDVIDIIQGLSVGDLAELIKFYGQEKYAQRIASSLKHNLPPGLTARQLAKTIEESVPANYQHGRIHPATRTFQALRLAVNRELEAITVALPQAVSTLPPNGLLGIISFHSLEDRVIKSFFKQRTRQDLNLLTKQPVVAGQSELNNNPRSRSARFRVVQKIINHKNKHLNKQSHDINHKTASSSSSSSLRSTR